MRILVVDDDAMLGRAAARCLRAHQVTVAGSVTEAQTVLKTDQFDLIISDVAMPGKSGPDFHRWLVEHHPNLAQRFLFTTGGMQPKDEAYVVGTGLRVIAKPGEFPQLSEIVRAMGT